VNSALAPAPPAAPVPAGSLDPPIPIEEPSRLGRWLAVLLVILVLMIAAVVILYLRQQGIFTLF
jgi:hypothetical protein